MAKPISDKLQKHLKENLSSYFEEDAFFILGISGGPDSMALLYLFHLLKIQGLVVHVNYGKRGVESDQDQELVEQMAFQWGYECCSIRLNPKEAKGENFQNWARDKRYQFFRDLKNDYKADAIALAHHQDDQVETILQKLFRGSSPVSWQGMQVLDGGLFRPLLSFNKDQILAFCESEAVPYRIDQSNKSSEFARNFIRNEFADKMNNLFPGWKENILELPRQGQTFEAAVSVIAERMSEKNTIDLKQFSALPEILKPAVLKIILDHAGLSGEYSKGQLKELAEVDSLQTGKSLKIGPLLLTRDRNTIHLHANDALPKISKKISLEEAQQGWRFKNISMEVKEVPDDQAVLQIDTSNCSWPLILRNWKSGDIFTPLGMTGSQKVSDHLTNRKIPTLSREKTLVLCGSDSTIYAIIYPVSAINGERGAISEMVKCTSETQTLLTINIS